MSFTKHSLFPIKSKHNKIEKQKYILGKIMNLVTHPVLKKSEYGSEYILFK